MTEEPTAALTEIQTEEVKRYDNLSLASADLQKIVELEKRKLKPLRERGIVPAKNGLCWGPLASVLGLPMEGLHSKLQQRLEAETDLYPATRDFDPFALDVSQEKVGQTRIKIVALDSPDLSGAVGCFKIVENEVLIGHGHGQAKPFGLRAILRVALRKFGRIPETQSITGHEVAHVPFSEMSSVAKEEEETRNNFFFWLSKGAVVGDFLRAKKLGRERESLLSSPEAEILSEGMAFWGESRFGLESSLEAVIKQVKSHRDVVKAYGSDQVGMAEAVGALLPRIFALGGLGVSPEVLSQDLRRGLGKKKRREGGNLELVVSILDEMILKGSERASASLGGLVIKEKGRPSGTLISELVLRDELRSKARSLVLQRLMFEVAEEVNSRVIKQEEEVLLDFQGESGPALLFLTSRTKGAQLAGSEEGLNDGERLCVICNVFPEERWRRMEEVELPPGSSGEGLVAVNNNLFLRFQTSQRISLGIYDQKTGTIRVPRKMSTGAAEKQGNLFLKNLRPNQLKLLREFFLSGNFSPGRDIYDLSEGRLQLWLFNHFVEEELRKAPKIANLEALKRKTLERAKLLDSAQFYGNFLEIIDQVADVLGAGAGHFEELIPRLIEKKPAVASQIRVSILAGLKAEYGENYQALLEANRSTLQNYFVAGVLENDDQTLAHFLKNFYTKLGYLHRFYKEDPAKRARKLATARKVLGLTQARVSDQINPFADQKVLSFSLNLAKAVLLAVSEVYASERAT